MATRTVHATLTPTGQGTITVDGHDLSNATRGISLRSEVGQMPEILLDLVVIETTRIDAEEVEVTIPTATAEALVALGWTPPATETD